MRKGKLKHEDSLECYAALSGKQLQTFQRVELKFMSSAIINKETRV